MHPECSLLFAALVINAAVDCLFWHQCSFDVPSARPLALQHSPASLLEELSVSGLFGNDLLRVFPESLSKLVLQCSAM